MSVAEWAPPMNESRVSLKVVEEAIEHARETSDEVVGLVLSNNTIVRLVNQARSPSRFSVGQEQMARALELINPDVTVIVALYHSHPGVDGKQGSPQPSNTDIEMMKSQKESGIDIPWLIVTPEGLWKMWGIGEDGEVCRLS